MAAPPFKVKALFEYSSSHDDDLKFSIGQIITVTEEEDDDWYCGEYVDDSGNKQEGLFPRNFVEKYEPTAPPRPTRTRTKKEEPPAQAPEPVAAGPSAVDEVAPPTAPAPAADDTPTSPVRASIPTAPVPAPAKPAEPVAVPAPVPAPAAPKQSEPAPAAKAAPPAKPSGPPPVSDKPSSNSFKDRLALFNKQAAPPPMPPQKPSGLGGGSGFIKKPFVAPPPSRNAYVPPPPRDVPVAKVYRRDEDPDVREQEAENQEQAEKAGLIPGASPTEAEDEDQPKPLSLKERMALLQKQQQEQAQRHADVVAKKEKPKRPPKKRSESHEVAEGGVEAESAAAPAIQRRDTGDADSKKSMDSVRAPPPPRVPSSRAIPQAESFNDGNEADMSGAGDTTEGQEDLTEQDDSDARPKPPIRALSGASPPQQTPDEEDEEEEEEGEEEEDDYDPEVRRKEELRARMAKMSGGMGFHGMFGPPGGMMGMPSGAPPPKKKKAPPPPEKELAEEDEDDAPSSRAAPPVPTMMALPGMSRKAPEPPAAAAEDDDEDDEEEDEPQQTPSM